MTRDDIIKLAREAGFYDGEIGWAEDCFVHFASLVAAHEREACAKVCEEPGWNAANWCAKQIRARGDKNAN